MSPQSTKSSTHDHAVDVICAGDCCGDAVKRAYREMKEQGQPDQFALDAAFRVFRWHHPDVPVVRAGSIVALWVHEGTVH